MNAGGFSAALGVATFVACATARPPFVEPSAPQPFASVVVECPPTLEEKKDDDKGVFTSSAELRLALVRSGESFEIAGACGRKSDPLRLPPGSARLEAGYKESVKQKNSVLETPVSCELPTLSQEWEAGKTYVYRVTVATRDTHGRFHSCNVTLSEAQRAAPSPSASASSSP